MARREQLEILCGQGVRAWNRWRENKLDVSGAQFVGAILHGVIGLTQEQVVPGIRVSAEQTAQ